MRTLDFTLFTLVIAALSFTAAPTRATTAAGSCESLWVAYNNCLVGSDGYFEKKLCDLDFVIAMTACRRLEQ